MIINNVDSGDFIKTLLTLSAAYMNRIEDWEKKHVPNIFKGVNDRDVKDLLKDPFDFIVVGSGYAGSLLASKLAQMGCYRVLLLEEGDSAAFDQSIPFLKSLNTSAFIRDIKTVPQPHAAEASPDRMMKLRVAKGLGGSSLLDYGVFHPENIHDFGSWATQFRLHDWAPEFIHKYLIDAQIGVDGEVLNASRIDKDGNFDRLMDKVRRRNPLSFLWLEAGRELKYPVRTGIDRSLNDEGGFFVPQVSTKDGFLLTPVNKFLKSAEAKNLIVITGAEVIKLTYAANRREVTGVRFIDKASDKEFMARAGKEVLLTAGAIGTAKILMQSGIGQPSHLRENGIDVIRSLPVGTSLRDRVRISMFAKMRELFTDHMMDTLMEMDQFEQYFKYGTGLLATPYPFGSALLRSRRHGDPDLLIEARPFGLLGKREMKSIMATDPVPIEEVDPQNQLTEQGGMQICLTILRPFSVGNMWLRRSEDNKTFDAHVNPNYLSDGRDVAAFVEAIKFVENVIDTEYMQLMEATILKPNIGSCRNDTADETEYWRCYVRHMTATGEHLTTTAAMGKVVDDELKVLGIRRLRVVDEAAFPSPVNGGSHTSAMVMVRKALEMIERDNRNFQCPVFKN